VGNFQFLFWVLYSAVNSSCGLRRVGTAQATASSPARYYQQRTKFF